MRAFSFITLGVILEELNEELRYNQEKRGKEPKKVSRPTLLRATKALKITPTGRTTGGWRTFTRERAEELKQKIKEGMSQPTDYTVQFA